MRKQGNSDILDQDILSYTCINTFWGTHAWDIGFYSTDNVMYYS